MPKNTCGRGPFVFYSIFIRNIFFVVIKFGDYLIAQCLRILVEEDLLFFIPNISNKIIAEDGEYIDDFGGLGLIYGKRQIFLRIS